MKVLLFGKNSENIKELVEKLGLEVITQNPEVILSFGGDGTLLSSERNYPSVPKLPIRDSLVCKKCSEHGEEVLLKKLLEGKLELKEYSKLETEIENQKLLALNDFVIRNKEPMHSIRFIVSFPQKRESINNKLLIGDGIVVSTPFGSTGYFKSITGQSFEKGFGLAFNNTTEKLEPQFFTEKDEVNFKLVRGQAGLTSDNNPDIFPIAEGSEIIFELSHQKAKIYELESLRCPNCKVTRG